jgi:microcystin-dependent protein
MDEFIGTIKMFGFNFAPRGWALCNGQLLSIAQNTALFSLLGTTYGGDGQTTFALPNYQSRFPIHWGQGPGLSPYSIGQASGSETVTITVNELPPHNHATIIQASAGTKLNTAPAANNLGGASIYTNAALDSTLNPAGMGGLTGGGAPTPTLPPYLAVSFCICMEGLYPSRN